MFVPASVFQAFEFGRCGGENFERISVGEIRAGVSLRDRACEGIKVDLDLFVVDKGQQRVRLSRHAVRLKACETIANMHEPERVEAQAGPT